MIDAGGYPIAASVYEAHGSDTVVVINAATGVPPRDVGADLGANG
jgi:hypothetical protein